MLQSSSAHSSQAQVSQLAGPSGPRFPDAGTRLPPALFLGLCLGLAQVPSCARFLVAKRAPRREPEQAEPLSASLLHPLRIAPPLQLQLAFSGGRGRSPSPPGRDSASCRGHPRPIALALRCLRFPECRLPRAGIEKRPSGSTWQLPCCL